MKRKAMHPLAGLVLLTACADGGAHHHPILDGTPTPAYEADLAACQALARDQSQLDHETMGATLLGAGAGAALGEAERGDALGGAVAGALAGGLASTGDVRERRSSIVVECLRGRGHRVVG
ncbi:glycine zipper family protein [Primorskyibacter sp. S187A]|uniref:glycine zipper family protein n=1 Tax=Primorskyibacter sp. S187A TaxID=3415130 RepID=UPI003C7CF4EB